MKQRAFQSQTKIQSNIEKTHSVSKTLFLSPEPNIDRAGAVVDPNNPPEGAELPNKPPVEGAAAAGDGAPNRPPPVGAAAGAPKVDGAGVAPKEKAMVVV
eukprot:scaffold77239_cov86-Cyclotella_meneghiniana.AAC.3